MADVKLYTPGSKSKEWNENDPVKRANAVREANAASKAGDLLFCGPGFFDFGRDENLKLKDAVSYKGCGLCTHWYSSGQSDKIGTAIALGNMNIVSDMLLEIDIWNKQEDGRLIGWDNNEDATVYNCAIDNCKLICNDWTIYNWTMNRNLVVSDTYFQFGRFGVVQAYSAALGDCNFDVLRCHFDGDGYRSQSVGASSSQEKGGVFGAMNRRGRMRIIDCSFDLKGAATVNNSAVPRVAAVTDEYGTAGEPTRIEVFNMQSQVTPNGTPEDNCWDIDLRGKNTSFRQGGPLWGSADDGGWITQDLRP